MLAAIVESSDDAIISKNLEGTILSWNQGAERLYGYTAKEAIGRHVSMLEPTGQTSDIPGILESLRHGKRIGHHETQRMHKNGDILQISLTISPLKTGNKIIGASVVARDITERKRAEQLLRASEERFSIAFNASPISSVISTLNEGRIRRGQ